MAKNPNSKPCKKAGCKAWAMRGHEYCSAHRHLADSADHATEGLTERGEEALASRANEAVTDLCALSQKTQSQPLEDVQVIDKELRNLFAARAVVVEWIEQLSEKGWQGAKPSQFLRAWNDSTSRVIQLLRARRSLSGEAEGEFGALLSRAYDELEESPALRVPQDKSSAHRGQDPRRAPDGTQSGVCEE